MNEPVCAICGGRLEASEQYPQAGMVHSYDGHDWHVPVLDGPGVVSLTAFMHDVMIREAVTSIVADMVATAKAAPLDEPVQFVTGNSYFPPIRSYPEAEAIWQVNGAGELWTWFAEALHDAEESTDGLYVGVPEYDNSLYVVDTSRFEYVDEDTEAETLHDEWRPIGQDEANGKDIDG